MQVEIITIGDEILIGQIVDTNSAWMAVELNRAGFDVVQITSVHDQEQHIVEALDLALNRADIVLFTGGIGPTKDDLTKQTLCRYFDAKLVFDEQVYANIENLLKHRSRAMNDLTKSQAMVPDKAIIIQNPVGTAPITWFEKDGKVVVSMPGVPYEMKQVMSTAIIPGLQHKFPVSSIIHKTILVHGYPESALAIKIAEWENSLPENIRLAYLPNFNIVKLRLTAVTDDRKEVEAIIAVKLDELKTILGDAVLAEEDIPLEGLVGRLFTSSGRTLVTAESCTGGYIAHKVTSVAGSSVYYKGSVVAYSNELKTGLLGVSMGDLNVHGAVSKEVVEQMAMGAMHLMNADVAIATSGIAGPDGGTVEKPVGTVWISICTKEKKISKMFQFNLGRALNIERTAQTALLMLLDSELNTSVIL